MPGGSGLRQPPAAVLRGGIPGITQKKRWGGGEGAAYFCSTCLPKRELTNLTRDCLPVEGYSTGLSNRGEKEGGRVTATADVQF